MFVRKKQNKSGSISVQVVNKTKGCRVVKTIGSALDPEEIKRAKKDKYNREKGLRMLEKRVASGKLTKEHLNNRGYNRFLKMTGQVNLDIDQDKIEEAVRWDGLKGYLTNTDLSADAIIENYSQLWHIEKAFRISKTDLRIRPMYHRRKKRIQAHILVAFIAYAIYKEL